MQVELHKEHEDEDLIILKLERNEVPANAGKLNSLMPSSPMSIPPFFTTLVQTDTNSHELLKPSYFERPDFSLGQVLTDLLRELPHT